jgi:protein-L-isoaspartate(D-aspartate) O-methyltransferase
MGDSTTVTRLSLLLILALLPSGVAASDDAYAAKRRAMVAEIEAMHAAESTPPGDKLDPRVLQSLARVPRHLFVPALGRPWAYANHPLPIGHGQTISQPYIVALMTHLLRPAKTDRVLEVGTGSGYQAAVLAELVATVHTIEIVEPLAAQARERLRELGYRNVEVRAGDGYKGWPEKAPFDAIMVTAGAEHVPAPLLQQLKPGGRMVIPVGPVERIQELTVIEKRADGSIERRVVTLVRFVPLTRER